MQYSPRLLSFRCKPEHTILARTLWRPTHTNISLLLSEHNKKSKTSISETISSKFFIKFLVLGHLHESESCAFKFTSSQGEISNVATEKRHWIGAEEKDAKDRCVNLRHKCSCSAFVHPLVSLSVHEKRKSLVTKYIFCVRHLIGSIEVMTPFAGTFIVCLVVQVGLARFVLIPIVPLKTLINFHT